MGAIKLKYYKQWRALEPSPLFLLTPLEEKCAQNKKSLNAYTYGFNGKEMDNEVSGNGNSYDYGFRIYNPRIGKFLSVDPLTGSFPSLTPYQYADNSPILNVDLDGLEALPWDKIWEKVKEGKNDAVKTATEVLDEQAAASLITVSKEIFPGVDKVRTEAQKQTSFSTSSDQTVAILLYEFATGEGEAKRTFNENEHPITNELIQGRVIGEIVSDFYKEVNENGVSFEEFAKGLNVNFGLEFSPDHTEGGLKESFYKHINSNLAQFFVAGANVSVSFGDNGNANVTISNPTSRHSLLLHVGESYSRDGGSKPLSTINQEFKFTISLDESKFTEGD